MAPVYDLDCSCDISKKLPKQRICANGGFGINSFIKQFGEEDWFKQYIQEIIQSFDIEKAFEQAKKATNIEIPKSYQEKYKTFFAQRMQEVKEAYFSLNKQEDLGENIK